MKSGIFLKVSSRILAFSARAFAAIVMDDEEEEEFLVFHRVGMMRRKGDVMEDEEGENVLELSPYLGG